MKVKIKVLAIFLASVLLLILCTWGIYYLIISQYAEKQEEINADNTINKISAILSREQDAVKRINVDWAHWDETYNYIKGTDENYVKDYLNEVTFKQLNINLFIMTNSQGNIIYKSSHGINENESERLLKKIFSKSYTLTAFKNDVDATSGLIYSEGKIYVVSASPVTDNDLNAKSNGTLIMARYVDNTFLDYIREMAKAEVSFSENTDMKNSASVMKIERDFQNLRAYKQLTDINGLNSINLGIVLTRMEFHNLLKSSKLFLIIFFILITIMIIMDMVLINKLILNRLNKLYVFIDAVGRTKDTSLRVNLPGKDEITEIAKATNRTLSQLDLVYNEMKVMDERFKTIMEAITDGYFDLDVKNSEIYISSNWSSYIGYTSKNGKDLLIEFLDNIHVASFDTRSDKLSYITNALDEDYQDKYKITKKSGEVIWVHNRRKVVQRDEDGMPLRVVGTFTDITARKKYEEDIFFLSYSDKLTGLKNRAFIEKRFREIDSGDESITNYSIIMGDLNGLKVINDTFGHKKGDMLIFTVGNMLKRVCEDEVTIGRWGGDEFVLLVLNKDYSYVKELVNEIKEECSKINDFSFDVSISLGSAEKSEASDTEAVMSLAEERMYRNKLIESRSSRNATISSLERTLYEKHSETEEHTLRIKSLSVMLGKKLGLSEEKLDELELVSLLHDIGKIAIPEHVLMKQGKLNEDEWETMKKHSEIGYRIAKSTQGLSHIADDILSHHEKFDGTGYPQGLKGIEIPLLARIINIVDSFDVMTNSRVYKEAYSIEYAVEELKRCSGKQFDPELVEMFLKLIEEKNIVKPD